MLKFATSVALALSVPLISFGATVHTIQGGYMRGDGTTDDTIGLRNAVAAAGVNGTVIVDAPPNFYLLNGTIGNTQAAAIINSVTIACTGATTNPTFKTTNTGALAYAFYSGQGNITIGGSSTTGCTFDSFDAVFADGFANSNAQIPNVNFTWNRVQNVTASLPANKAGFSSSGYLVNSHIDWNSFFNIFPGGYQDSAAYLYPAGCPAGGPDGCSHGGAGIGIQYLQHSTADHNRIDLTGGDAISWDLSYTTFSDQYQIADQGFSSVSYNNISRSDRFGIETVGACGGCSFDFNLIPGHHIVVEGNYYHDPVWPFWQTDGLSLVFDGSWDMEILNNTIAMNNATECYGGNTGDGIEYSGNSITMSGNVVTSVVDACSGWKGWIGVLLEGNGKLQTIATTGAYANISNNFICGPGSTNPFGIEETMILGVPSSGSTNSFPGHAPVNAQANALVESCSNQSNLTASGITGAFTTGANMTFTTGTGTENFAVKSLLSLANVAFFVDSSTTAIVVQDIQDFNSNFSASNPQWLYHATFSTASLTNGAHTIKAVATDVSGTTAAFTQPFTVTGGTGSNCSISTTSLPAGTVGVPYSQALTQSGCGSTGTWSIPTGGLPSGFALNASTGVISNNNPTVAGTSNFTAAYSLATTTVPLSITINAAQTACTQNGTQNSINGLYSDTFPCSTLAPWWTILDPVGGSSVSIASGVVTVAVPAGPPHDAYTNGQQATVLAQPLRGNQDFTATAKFTSTPSGAYQGQGIIAIQDTSTFARCEVLSSATAVLGYTVFVSGTTETDYAGAAYTAGSPYWVRLARVGSAWTCSLSHDGSTFTAIATFTQAMTVSQIGITADTSSTGGSAAAFTETIASWTVVQPANCPAGTQNLTNGLYSDAFTGSCLSSVWTLQPGATTGTATVDSTGLHLNVPTSTAGNDAYGSGDQATVLTQPLTGNADFTVTAAFSTTPTLAFQGEGIQAIADSNNFNRCEFLGNGSGTLQGVVYAVAGASGVTTPTPEFEGAYAGAAPLYMRLVRTGTNWVCSASHDNVTFTQLAAWNQTLTITKVGITADTGPSGGTAPAWNETVTSFTVLQPIVITGSPFPGTPISYGQVSLSSSFVPDNQIVTMVSSTPGTFTPVSSAFAGSFVQTDSTHASYQAPASVRPQHVLAGCMVGPNDSIFNTRVDALPVNSNSAQWTNNTTTHTIDGQPLAAASALPYIFSTAFAHNLVDTTVPAVAQTFEYTTAYTGRPFQVAPTPNKREGGTYAFTEGSNFVDHHVITMDYQSCIFYELYLDNMTNPYPSCPSGKVCTAASGWAYSGVGYPLPTLAANGGGATDAAGFPLMALTLHASEVLAGKVNHALRWTTPTGYIYNGTFLWPAAGANGGDNTFSAPYGARRRLKASVDTTGIITVTINNPANVYTVSPTSVTFAGCGTPPTATITMSGQNVSSINVTGYGSTCTNPTATLVGGTCAGAACTTLTPVQFNAPALTILTAAKQYGDFVADATSGNSAWVVDADMNSDASLVQAMRQVVARGLKSTDFEYVDESALQVAQNSLEVPSAASSGSSAEITFTPTSGASITFPIALQGIAVGTPFLKATMWAGEPAYTIPYWVTGDVSNAGATWALANCSAGTGNCGTITSAGAFMPPASITNGTYQTVTATATSVADASQSTSVYLTITPAGGLRVDSGASVSYTDTASNIWLPDLFGLQIENLVTPFDNDLPANDPNGLWLQGFARGVADITLWRTGVHGLGGTNGAGDIYFEPIIVPANGPYDVQFRFGVTSQNQGPTSCWGSYTTSTESIGAMNLITNGTVQAHGWDPGIPGHMMCRTPVMVDIPANVTNRLLTATIATNSTAYNEPFINAYSITPYTGTVGWAIDTQQTTQLNPTQTAQLYVQDWGTGFSDATWKVVSGPGSISSTGIFTAPTSQAITAKANITACSQSHPTVCGSTQIIVVGAAFNGLAQ